MDDPSADSLFGGLASGDSTVARGCELASGTPRGAGDHVRNLSTSRVDRLTNAELLSHGTMHVPENNTSSSGERYASPSASSAYCLAVV